jgi:hypothetical protein
MNKTTIIRTITLIFFLASFTTYSQEDEDTENRLFSESIITASFPLSNIPRLNIGYITAINNRWLAGLDIGYGASFLNGNEDNNFTSSTNYRLFEIRPQLYYTFTNNPKIRTYISAELFLIAHKDQFTSANFGYYIPHDMSAIEVGFDQADYTRLKTGLNIYFGLFKRIYRGFGINPSIAFGVRNRSIRYDNVINPVEQQVLDEGWFTNSNVIVKEGNYFGLNFNFKLKLYIKF